MGTIYIVTIEGILLAFKWVRSGGGRHPIMCKMDTQNRKFSEASMTNIFCWTFNLVEKPAYDYLI